jgi:eukaryotic-like serine/threonine-protein kinase
MSPEQLRAKPVDHRSDIFSVGTILYEILTGNRAFRGETDVDTMTAVLREDPPEKDWEHNRIPAGFKQVVMHCLEKEPQNRFQTARDLAFALATLSTAGGGKGVSSLGFGKDQIRRIVAWASAGLACAAALVLLVVKLRPTEPETNFRRMTFEQGTVYSARFAPDGQSIIYAAAWNNQPLQLYSTPADRAQARSLELGDANLLAISRSNELALALHGAHRAHLETENGILAVSPLDGGSPRELLDDVRWADWDGKGGLAVVHHAEGLSRLEYPVGHVLYESGGWISHIRFSPRSDRIAFLDHPALWDDRGSVCVTDLAGHVIVLSSGWGSEDGLGGFFERLDELPHFCFGGQRDDVDGNVPRLHAEDRGVIEPDEGNGRRFGGDGHLAAFSFLARRAWAACSNRSVVSLISWREVSICCFSFAQRAWAARRIFSVRSSGVIFLAVAFPPFLPNFAK